jgi:hypothetical protein
MDAVITSPGGLAMPITVKINTPVDSTFDEYYDIGGCQIDEN